jgi:hypothetical protein
VGRMEISLRLTGSRNNGLRHRQRVLPQNTLVARNAQPAVKSREPA